MRMLLVDNYDSFTWNIYALIFKAIGVYPDVVKNDVEGFDFNLEGYDCVVISPGPGSPAVASDLGISGRIIEEKVKPILGVCLGHQAICHVGGGTVGHAPRPCHGEIEAIHHFSSPLFESIPTPFNAVRYHSLIAYDVPPGLAVSAQTSDGLVMAIESGDGKLFGVQFHPESICSEHGEKIIQNFASLVASAGSPKEEIPWSNRAFKWTSIESGDVCERLYTRLYQNSSSSFWLDTSKPSETARFSFMGDASGPLSEVYSYDVISKLLKIKSRAGTENRYIRNLFDHVGELVRVRKMPATDELPFQFNCGFIGYLGYEMKAETGGEFAHKSAFPDSQFIFCDRLIAYDHQERCFFLLAIFDECSPALAETQTVWMTETEEEIRRISQSNPENREAKSTRKASLGVSLRHPREAYISKINECLGKIIDGESYEICLTNELKTDVQSNPGELYSEMRHISPVPFGALLKFDDLSVLCSSPERFLSVSPEGIVEAKPIKGTRPRLADDEADAAVRNELAASRKDRAENLMIVDLLRNDISQVCTPESVHVPKLFDVETYATVHQLVSTVRGRLRASMNAVDSVKAAFPGGSMTGAPKIRTMQILDNLEEGPRGIYSGSIGYFSLCGAADFNIVIRTAVIKNNMASIGVGGAIIALSDPLDEYEEILVKARAPSAPFDIALNELREERSRSSRAKA